MSQAATHHFEVFLDMGPRTKYERERAAFRRLLPGLLEAHRGRYVAIHEEQVLDHDADEMALIERVLRRVGNVAIHVGLVTDQPPAPARMPHYHDVQARGTEK